MSAQNCPTCGVHFSRVVQLVQHMERHYGVATMYACTLCRNLYAIKVALDCHIISNHGGEGGVRHDIERKYKLGMQLYCIKSQFFFTSVCCLFLSELKELSCPNTKTVITSLFFGHIFFLSCSAFFLGFFENWPHQFTHSTF